MKNSAIAKRYAQALLLVAKNDGVISDTRKDLSIILKLLKEQRKLFIWLLDEEIPHQRRKMILRELAGSIKIHPSVLKFMEVLVEKERIKYFEQIARIYNVLADESEGIVRGKIFAVDKSIAQNVQKRLEGLLAKKLAKKVELELEEDPIMLGGIKIQLKDKIWDASLKRKLEEIKEQLCQ